MNIEIKVVPNARHREIDLEGSVLKVKLTSPPREGKANEELIEYLSDVLGLKRCDVRILRGQKGRKKLVSMAIDEKTLHRLLKEKVKVTIS